MLDRILQSLILFGFAASSFKGAKTGFIKKTNTMYVRNIDNDLENEWSYLGSLSCSRPFLLCVLIFYVQYRQLLVGVSLAL